MPTQPTPDVDSYIAAAPEAEERISYGMPS
jgi:uncharacterized protein YdhG (YjbR/CyaY superfamily)